MNDSPGSVDGARQADNDGDDGGEDVSIDSGVGGGDGGGGGGTVCGLGDCGYQSGRRGNLSRHRTTMHRSLASPLICCEAAFVTKHDYERHRRQAHAAGYRCGDCGRVFGRRALLTRHSYIHAERKPFQCTVCQRYSTASKSNLRRHRQVCGRTRAISPTVVTGPAAGRQDTLYSTGGPVSALPPPVHHLPPLFRASIHISCGPCGSAASTPGWVPWPTGPGGPGPAGVSPYHCLPQVRRPAPGVVGSAAGEPESPLLPNFAPGMFYNPLATGAQSATGVRSERNAQEALRRAALVNGGPMFEKDSADKEKRLFWPRMPLNLSTSQNDKHSSVEKSIAEPETAPAVDQKISEKPQSPPAVQEDASRGAIRAHQSTPRTARHSRVYRSFHVSDILALDD